MSIQSAPVAVLSPANAVGQCSAALVLLLLPSGR